jgi:FAD/FMN-containing dehydrogenase
MYAADASNYRRVPIGVVAPVDEEDVAAAVAVCHAHDVPLLPRGAGTSIAGQAVNTAVVVDFTRHLNRVLEIDPQARTARVQPGLVLDELRAAAAPHGLTFGPDPSTHNRCTLGGMIGNNACGSHSVAWGKTVDNVHALDVLTYRGERLSLGRGEAHGRIPDALRALGQRYGDTVRTAFPDLTRRVSGYNLDQLLPENGFDLAKAMVGTEGTCATLLAATVRLVESPPARALAVLGFPDAYLAADHVMAVRELDPLTIEGMDAGLIAALRAAHPTETASRYLPEGGGWLYVETGGQTRPAAEAAARTVVAAMAGSGATSVVVSDPAQMKALWRIREDGAGILTRSPDGGEAWPGWEDAAVPPERFGGYLREFDALLARHHRRGAYYGHFGDGCLHVRIDFDLLTERGIAGFRAFMTDAADLAVAHGGSLSGEHGDGSARAELLPRMYPPPVIRAFEEFKAIWDPDDRMNPDRIVRPAKLDEDLRVFVGMPTLRDEPELAFAHDRGSFTRATRRCLGVGKCITDHGGVMCPSYRATGEEMHSTRGRARLLFEMASGDVVTGGWQSPEVAEALDLCLSCKGCKRDCPVGVDMAAYKTEFLAQRYRGKVRPAAHYSMGALPRWMGPSAGSRRRRQPPSNAAAAPPSRGGEAHWAASTPSAPSPRSPPPSPLDPPPAPPCPPRSPAPAPDVRKATQALEVLKCFPDTGARVRAGRAEVVRRRGGGCCCGPTRHQPLRPRRRRRRRRGAGELATPRAPAPRRLTAGSLTSTGQVETRRTGAAAQLRTIEPWLREGVPVVGWSRPARRPCGPTPVTLLPDERWSPCCAEACGRSRRCSAGHSTSCGARWQPPGRGAGAGHCHQHAERCTDADEAVDGRAGHRRRGPRLGLLRLAATSGSRRATTRSMACAERVLLPPCAAAPRRRGCWRRFSCPRSCASGTREPGHLATLAARACRSARPRAERRRERSCGDQQGYCHHNFVLDGPPARSCPVARTARAGSFGAWGHGAGARQQATRDRLELGCCRLAERRRRPDHGRDLVVGTSAGSVVEGPDRHGVTVETMSATAAQLWPTRPAEVSAARRPPWPARAGRGRRPRDPQRFRAQHRIGGSRSARRTGPGPSGSR